MFAEGGDDVFFGAAGDDTIFGAAGDDTLIGGDGDDVLYGQGGNDELIGSAGADTFVLQKAPGTDTIVEFTAQDFIGLLGSLTYGDLSFSGNDIILNSTSQVLATLTGVDATTLDASQFVSV